MVFCTWNNSCNDLHALIAQIDCYWVWHFFAKQVDMHDRVCEDCKAVVQFLFWNFFHYCYRTGFAKELVNLFPLSPSTKWSWSGAIQKHTHLDYFRSAETVYQLQGPCVLQSVLGQPSPRWCGLAKSPATMRRRFTKWYIFLKYIFGGTQWRDSAPLMTYSGSRIPDNFVTWYLDHPKAKACHCQEVPRHGSIVGFGADVGGYLNLI